MSDLDIQCPGRQFFKASRHLKRESVPNLADSLADELMELDLSANPIVVTSFVRIFRLLALPIIITEDEIRDGLAIMNDAFRTIRTRI